MNNSIPEKLKELIDDHNYFESRAKINEVVNDDENPIEVFMRKGDEETTLSNPSLALYYGDRGLYEQEVRQITDEQISSVLNITDFPRNKRNFEELKETIQGGIVIPFIGAGLSISAGCPTWASFLADLMAEHGIDSDDAKALLASGDYERLMTLVIAESPPGAFEQYFAQDFKHEDITVTPCTLLPRLFDKCVITTNFDLVVDESYKLEGMPFSTQAIGLHDEFTFLTSVPKGQRCILKLHGNINNQNHRVLTHEEYQSAYGDDGLISFNNHIPKLLKRIYLSYSLFFIGCSMNIDRTVQTFEKIVAEETAHKVPEHYALLEVPEDDEAYQALKQRMIACNIKPIWYPNGEHQLIEELLFLLIV
ncbi:MAG: hypothetical protein ACJA2Y_001405 [Cycloclasticus pugetii]|jgi:hypothetical protein|uniref:SIR2 family protein n=1 Tax=Cycloclasticus pugetii TaxID=34068 RepID=UPI0039E6138A